MAPSSPRTSIRSLLSSGTSRIASTRPRTISRASAASLLSSTRASSAMRSVDLGEVRVQPQSRDFGTVQFHFQRCLALLQLLAAP